MPRKKRFNQVNAFHHVMLRGNGGQNIFLDDQSRVRFCLMLQKASEEHHFLIHAFCLMSNHIHLLLEPTSDPLSLGVKAFAGRYAQYFNRRFRHSGHLFQDRFRSILVQDSGMYLMRLVRYIHLNPVRARLVTNAQDYFWSSHRSYLELQNISWLTQFRVLQKFGLSDSQSRLNLTKYIDEKPDAELDAKIVRESYAIGAFGSAEFVEHNININNSTSSVTLFNGQMKDLIDAACSVYKVDPKHLASTNREKRLVDIRSILALAIPKTRFSLADLAIELNRDSSTLSRLALRAANSSKLAEETEKFMKHLLPS